MIAAATLSLSQFHDRAGLGLDREMAEEEEFEMFIRSYQNMVFSVSARIVGNLTDAEDITQEVFIKAYARFKELRNSEHSRGMAQNCGHKSVDQSSQSLPCSMALFFRAG